MVAAVPCAHMGLASRAHLLWAPQHVCSDLGRGKKQSVVVVADASQAPAKGDDAGGRFGVETQAAKSPIRGEMMLGANHLVLSCPAAFNWSAHRCQILTLSNAPALSGNVVLFVSVHFILCP